ncbi:MAG: zinc dependent phospholipase C family protein, partial [Clostridia bacterium]|nr:zinc dependent phospholipase C family protein [Clostridia bacterium]
MPDLLTHTIFSRLVRNEVKSVIVKSSIERHMNLFQLGAQGPDFFFYYKPLSPFSRKISNIGRMMHDKSTATFFLGAVKEIEKTKTDSEQFFVYLLGFLCHFYLDKNVHPYVDYVDKHGVWDFNGQLSKMTHYYLEYTIDTRLWKEYENKEAVDQNLASLIRVDKMPAEIIKYFHNYFQTEYDINVPEKAIRASFSNMFSILNILYDPDYRKTLLRKLPTPRKYYVHDPFPQCDVLNNGRNVWCYKDEKIPMNESVADLMMTAKKEAVNTIDKIVDYLNGDKKIKLEEIIENVSYNTNRLGQTHQ